MMFIRVAVILSLASFAITTSTNNNETVTSVVHLRAKRDYYYTPNSICFRCMWDGIKAGDRWCDRNSWCSGAKQGAINALFNW